MKKFLITAAAAVVLVTVAFAQDAVRPAASATPATTAETERVVVVGGAIERSETDKAQSVIILNENSLEQKAAGRLPAAFFFSCEWVSLGAVSHVSHTAAVY